MHLKLIFVQPAVAVAVGCFGFFSARLPPSEAANDPVTPHRSPPWPYTVSEDLRF